MIYESSFDKNSENVCYTIYFPTNKANGENKVNKIACN